MSQGSAEPVISKRLFEIARQEPNKELVFDPTLGRFTYGEIAEEVRRLARGLSILNLGPDDVVILQLPNRVPFIVFHLALTAIGAITANVPIIYRENELRTMIALTQAKALIVPRNYGKDDFIAIAEVLSSEHSSLEHIFLVGGDADVVPDGMIGYERFMKEQAGDQGGESAFALQHPDAEDLTVLGFTSGTTGELKGAMLSSNTLRAWNMGLIERYGLTADDRIFAGSPLGHAVAFGHCLRMTFTLGASIVLLDRWSADAALDLIADENCTLIAGATPFLMDLIYHPALQAHDSLRTLRLFLCGGAAIPQQLLEDAHQALPHTFVTPLWGMTECGGVTTCPRDASSEKLYTTDGSPCGGMELKIVDPSGQSVPHDTEGELMARGPMGADGYYGRPELTAEAFQADGFFRTGDQAYLDKDGYIKITGRIKDLIIRGGVNIAPVEIENVLFSHPKVVNVAVVGTPDPRLGERVCAFVILQAGETLDVSDVQHWMEQARVAKPKWPERIETVTEFPMTPSGKIQKFRLREALAGTLLEQNGLK